MLAVERTPAEHSLNDTVLAELHVRLAAKLSRAGSMDSAFAHVRKAQFLLAPFQNTTDARAHQLLAISNRHAGRLTYFDSKYDESLKYMQAAFNHATQAKDSVELGRSLMYMGYCFREMNDSAQALIYTRKAMDIFSRIGARTDLGTAIMSMGGTFTNLGITDSALHYFRRALSHFQGLGDRTQTAATLLNIAGLFDRTAAHDSVHHYVGLAAPYADALSPPSQVRYRGMLGRDLVIHKEFKKGLDELHRAEEMAEGNPSDLAEILQVKALAYAGLHDMTASMIALRAGNDAMLEDLDLEKVQAVTEQRMEFEHDLEIATAAAELAAEQQRKRNLLIGTAGVLLIGPYCSCYGWLPAALRSGWGRRTKRSCVRRHCWWKQRSSARTNRCVPVSRATCMMISEATSPSSSC